MAYSTSAPPVKIAQGMGAGSLWYYTSTDADSDVDAAGYFTDGDDLGMKVGDFVLVYESDAIVGSFMVVSAVTAGGAATVQFGAVA